jgi:hypothetical protein
MTLKPGYKTTEAIAVLAAALASWVAHWASTLSAGTASKNTAYVAIAYALSRGIAKLGALLAQPTITTQPAPPPPPAAPGPIQV